MMEFTHKNHYKFGWGDGTYNFDNKEGQFWTKYGRAEYDPGPRGLRFESIRAAKLIAESATKPLAVMFSGGMDSEAVVRSLMEAGADFECIVSRYNYRGVQHINAYDTKYAFDFIKEHGLKYRTIDIDLLDWLMNIYPEQAAKFKVVNRTWLLHTWVLSQFPDHHVICGGGDIQLNRYAYKEIGSPSPETVDDLHHGLFVHEKDHIVSAYEIAQELGTNCSLRFFRQTPELMLAWLNDSDVKHYIAYEKSFSSFIRRGIQQMHYLHLKPWVFHKYWTDLTPRVKYHGFELTYSWLYEPGVTLGIQPTLDKPEYSAVRAVVDEVHTLYKRPDNDCRIDVHDLLEQLTPQK